MLPILVMLVAIIAVTLAPWLLLVLVPAGIVALFVWLWKATAPK